jgi:hypothetical protein
MSVVEKGFFALSYPGAKVAFKDKGWHFAPFYPKL